MRIPTILLALVGASLFSLARAQSDINLNGYTSTFDDEFNSVSVTSTSPKGASTWYYAPPYGSAGLYSDSIWDATDFSVSSGILAEKAALVFTNQTAGTHTFGPLNLKNGSGTPLVTGATLGTARTNTPAWYVGEMGMEFTTGSGGLTVSSVGRWVISGNSLQHLVRIVDASTGADVPNGSAVITTSGATAGAYAYASLPSTITLQANHSYYLLSSEGYSDNSGHVDSYYNDDTTVTTTSAITTSTSTYGTWHSGNLSSVDPTKAGFSQQYGYFEIRCQMPSAGTGAWPAFWLETTSSYGTGATQNEEVDIFEWYGVTYSSSSDLLQQTSHNWNTDGSQNTTTSPYLPSTSTPLPGGAFPWQGYHIYGVLIDHAHMTWYIDGVQVNQCGTPTAYLTGPFYMMADYALGGGWPMTGTVNPSSFNIDWIRAYSLPTFPLIINDTATGTQGTVFSYQISAQNSPTSYNATGLPSGLTVNTTNGMITGTPTSSGLYSVTMSATNANGTGTATLTLAISSGRGIGLQFPGDGTAMVSTDSAGILTTAQTGWNALTGASFSNQALADNTGAITPATLTGTASGVYYGGGSTALPAGNAKLASGELFDGSTAGSNSLTVAKIPYAFYDVYAYANIDASGRNETVSLTPTGSAAQYYSFTTEGGGSVWTAATSTWNGTGTAPTLPTANYAHFAGLTASSFTMTFWAPANGGMNGIQIVPTPPAITSSTSAAVTVGTSFSYTITATTNPTSYNATGLPTGLTINKSTGVISGTPTVSGIYPVMITATSLTGSTTVTLSLTVAAPTSDTPVMPPWALALLGLLLVIAGAGYLPRSMRTDRL